MRQLFRRRIWLGAALMVALSLTATVVSAHEGRGVGQYRFVVGFAEEPAFEGMKNGVDIRVTKMVEGPESHGHQEQATGQSRDPTHKESHGREERSKSPEQTKHGETTASGAEMTQSTATEHAEEIPMEGLEGSLQVEVTHVATNVSRVLELRAVPQNPGHYTADLIPTAAGVYQFRVFGVVDGEQMDETFVSKGGGGDFSDIESSASLQFPEDLPELRELESAVRGALHTAEAAQDAALGSASGKGGGGSTLAIVAIVMGTAGMLSGAGSLLVAARRK